MAIAMMSTTSSVCITMQSRHSTAHAAVLPAMPSAFAGRRLCCKLVVQQVPAARRSSTLVVKAAQETQEKPAVAKFADDIGLPTDEGIFGFKPFAEAWVGRLAMLGFISSVVGEFVTGRGTLGQLGLQTPSTPLLVAILAVTGGATVAATAATFLKASSGTMTKQDAMRYRNFLGLRNEDSRVAEVSSNLKQRGDFTDFADREQAEQSRAEGTPADSVLSMADRRQALAEEERMKAQAGILTAERSQELTQAGDAAQTLKSPPGPNMSLAARSDVLEQTAFASENQRYARGVELSNGRWAMLGFWAAITIEAATGQGIIGQVITYLKAVGLLGAASGF